MQAITLGGVTEAGSSGWTWLMAQLRVLAGRWRARPARRLRLCESLPLGERRLLAVVQFERQRFLIGASGNGLALLASLPNAAAETATNGNANHMCADDPSADGPSPDDPSPDDPSANEGRLAPTLLPETGNSPPRVFERSSRPQSETRKIR